MFHRLFRAISIARISTGPHCHRSFESCTSISTNKILTYCQIENCIDEWLSGTHISIDFSRKEYQDIYLSWIKELDNFNKYTKKHDLLDKILVKIHNRGRYVWCLVQWHTILTKPVSHRFHARAIPVSRLDLPKIPYHAFEAAMKEYEEDDKTEMDRERGDSD